MSSSAAVASQLRSEFASHGRDISSIAIHISGEGVSAGVQDHLEVEASRIGGIIVEDKILLSIEVCDGLDGVVPELVSGDAARYTLRVDRKSSPLHQVSVIIEALIKAGSVDRLSEKRSYCQPNSQFQGEIRLLADTDATAPILEEADYWGHNLVRYRDQIYAVPFSLGQVNFQTDGQAVAGLLRADSLAALRTTVLSQLLKKEYTADGAVEIRARLKALEESLLERTRRVASLEATVEERNQRLKGVEQTLEERRSALRRWRRPWKNVIGAWGADATNPALEAAMEERSGRLQAVEKTREGKDRRIAALEAAVSERRVRS